MRQQSLSLDQWPIKRSCLALASLRGGGGANMQEGQTMFRLLDIQYRLTVPVV